STRARTVRSPIRIQSSLPGPLPVPRSVPGDRRSLDTNFVGASRFVQGVRADMPPPGGSKQRVLFERNERTPAVATLSFTKIDRAVRSVAEAMVAKAPAAGRRFATSFALDRSHAVGGRCASLFAGAYVRHVVSR